MAAIAPEPLVVKVGGAELQRIGPLLAEIAERRGGVILVHGGGAEITRALADIGEETFFIGGRRVTSRRAVEVAADILTALNDHLCDLARAAGIVPVGDGGRSTRFYRLGRDPDARLDRVGVVSRVEREALEGELAQGRLPILSPICPDADGLLNINADDLAGAVAAALGADLVLFTDVSALRGPRGDIPELTCREALALIQGGHAVGGMVAKLEAACAAIERGAHSAWLGRMAEVRPLAARGAGGTHLHPARAAAPPRE